MSDELVTIATYNNYLDAEMHKVRLQSHGIPSMVSGGVESTTITYLAFVRNTIRLQVHEANAERALAILHKENNKQPGPVRIRKRSNDREWQKFTDESRARQDKFIRWFVYAILAFTVIQAILYFLR
jgi:hypothetical protein